ncbi:MULTISPECIES: sigma 54-interacting transcriptional regulator [Enterococcus]|uniref:sigma 54-interacting transcriptional regulator n=1 Tax=Enterococcus TaxID=1350 RepID=UPI000DD3AA4C|nr:MULTISPECIES: sigma 54-interacting transcriptional regulator [Enterococcus]MBX9039018.1 sigma 54-interacting transcriptional regulator [Enterococcus raffinosus]RGY39116.1 PRD domain-containing protein [Enterococcus avium]UXC28233.1 sigma 54-interacting transcriptional regulator [Enterococcus raffinosus]
MDKIIQLVRERTLEIFSNVDAIEQLTATSLSMSLGLKRHTVSSYLNGYVEEGVFIKITGRPVYFLDKQTVEIHLNNSVNEIYTFENFLDLIQPSKIAIFSEVIGAEGSLKEAIEKVKIGSNYPPNGLPILLQGKTGVGKSYLASIIYQYTVQQKLIKSDAPYIVFNCAQYANNVELLSSNLFGYVKGSFTGAENDRKGILEEADGGIIFLDEVHRLNDESQEKLFIFLDKGKFRRMGETSNWRTSTVRFIFATNQTTESFMLDTLYRRIPIKIELPDFEKRNKREKIQLVKRFLFNEVQYFNKDVEVNGQLIQDLISFRYDGNIGELQNLIKYICGKAYLESMDSEWIMINRMMLPKERLAELSTNILTLSTQETFLITKNSQWADYAIMTDSSNAVLEELKTNLLVTFENLSKNSFREFEEKSKQYITTALNFLILKSDQVDHNKYLFLRNVLREVFEIVRIKSGRVIHNNDLDKLSIYLINRMSYSLDDSKLENQKILTYLEEQAEKDVTLATLVSNLLEQEVNYPFSAFDSIFLTFYLRNIYIKSTLTNVKPIILCHGNATASSIANLANEWLSENIFDSYDMNLDISMKEIVDIIKQFVKTLDSLKSLLILVDTGSLNEIYNQLGDLPVSLGIINNVNTQMALEVGNMVLSDRNLAEICRSIVTNQKIEYKIIAPAEHREVSIITTCFTGIGTAIQIQEMLTESMENIIDLTVEAVSFSDLKNSKKSEGIFANRKVLAIVGTDDPQVREVPFIAVNELLTGESSLEGIFGSLLSNEELTQLNKNLIRNFTLENLMNSLTIINTEMLLTDIEEAISCFERLSHIKMPNKLRINLYIHICSMMERLIRKTPIKTLETLTELQQSYPEHFKQIKLSFAAMEQKYQVSVDEIETGIIIEILRGYN